VFHPDIQQQTRARFLLCTRLMPQMRARSGASA
jgi:hypothetical protein